jgi:hypothetical protein
MANGSTRPSTPGQVGASSIHGLMADSRPKRFTPKYANLQEVLRDALSRMTPATTQSTDDYDDEPDAAPQDNRAASLEDKLRTVLGTAVVDDLEQHGGTDLALSNWLHSTGVKHLACARTLAHCVAVHLDSMDLFERIKSEIEAIG